MTRPRHTEFVYKKARDLDHGDVIPRGRHLAATVDVAAKTVHYRRIVGGLRGIRLGWLAFGISSTSTRVQVRTQDGRQRTLRGGTRIRLVSPTTGPHLVATRVTPISLIGLR